MLSSKFNEVFVFFKFIELFDTVHDNSFKFGGLGLMEVIPIKEHFCRTSGVGGRYAVLIFHVFVFM